MLGEPRHGRAGELRLLLDARAARRPRSPRPRPRAAAAPSRRARARRSRPPRAPAPARRPCAACARGRGRAARAGSSAARSAASSAAARPPSSGSSRSSRSTDSAERKLARAPLDRDELALLARPVQLEVDARASRRGSSRGSASRRPRRSPRRSRAARRAARAAAPAAPARAGSRAARPRGRSRRRARAPRGARGTTGWEARLEAVDDVVAALLEGEREVRAHAHGHADARAARDREGRPERDQLGVAAVEERGAAGAEVGRPGRRRQHRDVVAEPSELRGRAGDVLVDVVRPRPGEGRDEADSEAHRPECRAGGAARPRPPLARLVVEPLEVAAHRDHAALAAEPCERLVLDRHVEHLPVLRGTPGPCPRPRRGRARTGAGSRALGPWVST